MKWKIWKTKNSQQMPVKKSKLREWIDAVLFAVVAATIIRGLLFSAYAIPSSSMEGTMLVGDYLFVSKISYGPRMPITPVAVPFTEPTITSGNIKTYWDGIKLPYYRLPGLGKVKKGDIVVFNKPEEANPAYPYKPIDERTALIKRCVATPGDVLTIVNSQLHINGRPVANAPAAQTTYNVVTTGEALNPLTLAQLHIETLQQNTNGSFVMIIPPASLTAFKTFSNIKAVTPVIEPAGYYDALVFPHNASFKWNEDNFGPLVLPAKGMTIPLNDSTLILYRQAIEWYEHNNVQQSSNGILLNNKPATQYTFKMNYYWMMGDNRHNSLDSRFWGYVPEDHIVGKAVFTWMSVDSAANLFNKIRWARLMKTIH